MIEASIPPQNICYNTLVSVSPALGLRKMVNSGLKLDTTTFNTVINHCAKARDLDAATRYLEVMQEVRCTPDVVTHNIYLGARSKTGDTQAVPHSLRALAASSLEPDVKWFTSSVHQCAYHGDMIGAERWFARMTSARVQPTLATFNAIINCYARGKNVSQAERWFRRLQEARLQADGVSYNCMIKACAKSRDVAGADRWLKAMSSEGRCEPDLQSYTELIRSRALRCDLAGVSQCLDRLSSASLRPDVVTWTMAIDACAKAAALARAPAAQESASVDQHDSLHEQAYDSWQERAAAVAEGFLRRMVEQSVAPNAATSAALERAVGALRHQALLSEYKLGEHAGGGSETGRGKYPPQRTSASQTGLSSHADQRRGRTFSDRSF